MEKIRNRPLKQQGFTLLELLIALALSLLVVGLLTMGVYLVLQDWERAGGRLDDKLDASLALLQIERALQGAFPHLYRHDTENRSYIYFEGNEKKLSWVSTVSPTQENRLTAWQLQRGEEDKGLRVAYTPAFAGNPEKALKKLKPLELFTDYTVSFEYLYIDEQKPANAADRSEWREQWSGKKRQSLPAAVRLRLEKSDDPAAAQEIVALLLAREHFNLPPVLGK